MNAFVMRMPSEWKMQREFSGLLTRSTYFSVFGNNAEKAGRTKFRGTRRSRQNKRDYVVIIDSISFQV